MQTVEPRIGQREPIVQQRRHHLDRQRADVPFGLVAGGSSVGYKAHARDAAAAAVNRLHLMTQVELHASLA